MENVLPLDKMSVEEKIQAMESLWDELCSTAGGVVSPPWHEQLLTDREGMRARGDDHFEDWEVAKRHIRNKTS